MSIESTVRVEGAVPIFHAVYPEESQDVNPTDAKVSNLAKKAFDAIGNFFYQGIHKIIGFIAVLPAQNPLLFLLENAKAKKEALKTNFGGEEIKFQTADNVTLDGMHFLGENCQKSDRTVILFNGNGVRYEQYGGDTLLFNIESWQKQGWNVLVFNYRGVGDSKGIATRDGLVLDGDAAFQCVRDQMKVSEERILLHGHSLGGGIASEVAAKHSQVNYCNDRSFSSLSKQVQVMFGNGVIGFVASRALSYFGWEYNARDNWDKINGKKLSVYHEKDSIIPEGARFYEFLEDSDSKIKLNSSWVKLGTQLVADDPAIIDDYIKNWELLSRLMGKKFGFLQKLPFYLMKLATGQIAHMRKYSEQDEAGYFTQINTI